MKILRLLSAASAAVLAVSTLAAQEAAPATEPAKAETAAAPAAVETAAAPVAAEISRPLPKVRQGTPFTGDRGRMITFSILFFLLSVFMAGLLLRTKEDVPT